ncbi:MAG: ABC transporter permease [Thermodesulfobacteriota bacterium]
MKQLKLFDYALTALWRRPGKTVAILVAYTLVVTILASVLFLGQSLRQQAKSLLAGAPELIVQMQRAGRHELMPVAAIAEIRAIPGVRAALPRLWGYHYDTLTKGTYTVQAAPQAGQAEALVGRLPETADECVLGPGVAALRELTVDDDLVLIDSGGVGRSFVVTGIFSAESRLLTNDLVLLTEEGVRDFFALPAGQATDIEVRVANPEEVANIAAKISRRLPGARPISRREILRTYDSVFSWRSGMLLLFALSSLLAFALLAWDKATGLSGAEKREIGILKAVGWDTGDVLACKFWEGASISLAAVLTGLVLAYVHVYVAGAPLIATVMRGWSVLFPAFDPVPALAFTDLLSLFFFTIAPYLASTLLPAWRAAAMEPDTVMRS